MPEVTKTGLTRQKLLKRAAIGGAAAAWSMPFLASTASAGHIRGNRKACYVREPGGGGHLECFDCITADPLRVCKSDPVSGTDCYCFDGTNGCCECTGNFSCGASNGCTTNRQCPAGWKCVAGCCSVGSGFPGFCAPPCGHGISAAAAAAGRSNIG